MRTDSNLFCVFFNQEYSMQNGAIQSVFFIIYKYHSNNCCVCNQGFEVKYGKLKQTKWQFKKTTQAHYDAAHSNNTI